MNSTLLTVLILAIFLALVYFISSNFLKKNDEYVEKCPVKNPEEESEKVLELEVDPVLTGTIKPVKEVKKETKKKTPKKKSSSLSSAEELPKVKKSSYKKSYNKKRKDVKKDKDGDGGYDLLLS